MCGECMAQSVRSDAFAQAGPPSGCLDDPPRSDAGERTSARIQKQKAPSLAPVESRSNLAGIERDLAERATPHRHDSLFGALAEDARDAVLKQNVLQLEGHELGDAHAGRVRKLDQRPIANRQRLVRVW